MSNKPVILTGLRTNAEYHLGNYLGAIKPMVELQKQHIGEYKIHMFAPDLHSFTTPIDHRGLYRQTIDNLKLFVASGMPLGNPDFFIYRQSAVPAHSELAVILGNFTYFGELSRMTQFKDRSASGISQVTSGLFTYPVLMAADILLYDASYVPLGSDQQQHLELTRDIAQRFNNKFGDTFVVPYEWAKQLEFSMRQEGVRIRSLKHPESKMSKSVEDPAGTILLSDSPESAVEKISRSTTDSLGEVNWDWENQPGVTNLLQILGLLEDKSKDQILEQWRGNSNYGELKTAVAEKVDEFLQNLQDLLSAIDESELHNQLTASESAVNKTANNKLEQVQRAVGLRR